MDQVPGRRTPVQERSALRVQRMLDAAAELLDEVGYEATTTSQIASRAGVSVGSLYQFFPDRRAVLQALAERSFGRLSAAVGDAVIALRPPSWREALEIVVDVCVEFATHEPAAQVLSFGGPGDWHMFDPDSDNNAIIAAGLAQVLQSVVPGLRVTPALFLALRVAVEAGDSVLSLSLRRSRPADPALVAQTKHLLTTYLADYLD